MKRTSFDETRDQVAADRPLYPKGFAPEMMCRAHGCPNRWSVDKGDGGLCSAHAWEPPERWHWITDEQSFNETERARVEPKQPAPTLTFEDKKEILARLAQVAQTMRTGGGDPKRWAVALKEREESGEVLSTRQRECWRAALGPAGEMPS